MIRALLVALVMMPALASAEPDAGVSGDRLEPLPAAASEPEMTDEELAAEEDAEATIDEIEDEVFGRSKKQHRRRHHEHRESHGPERKYAVAWNVPLGGLGGSFYRALGRHFALRFNVAAYRFTPTSLGVAVLSGLLGDPIEDEPQQHGGTFDIGAGVMAFPQRLWSGATFELGVVRRARDIEIRAESPAPITTETSSKYAGRALVGWTWNFGPHDRLFVATALGASYGFLDGGMTVQRVDNAGEVMGPPMFRHFARWEAAFECYMRVGFSFGGAP